jgi:hydrophobe/amphiphile efflux-3 (HAE3) family protein
VNPAALLAALAGGAARRSRLVVAIAVALGLGGAALALRLHATAATSTFVSSASGQYRATQRFYAGFGEDPVAVLVRGDLQQLVLSSDVDRLVGLEGCLAGKVPAAALAQEGGVDGPCGQLARAGTVKVVLGPGTFINEAASQINEQLALQSRQAHAEAAQAEQAVYRAALARGLGAARARSLGRQASRITIARFEEGLVTQALQYGLTARPSIDDANFVSSLVFDSSRPAGTPKQRFAYLFPNRSSALISVRLRAGLSEAQRRRTIELIRRAVGMSQWQLTHGESYLVTGVPVIVADLTGAISHAIELLMIAVGLVMAATLALIFSGRPRLLPLGIALVATALTFGALSLVGASLTMASVAVLPVLVGLAVDYAIQFQSRVAEAFGDPGDDGEPRVSPAGARRAPLIASAAAAGAPTIVTAGAASAAAMLALLLSPVPMVRGFGVLLVVGVAIALACALTVGAAAMARPAGALRLPGAGRLGSRVGGRGRPRAAFSAPLGAAWRGARELVLDNPLTRLLSRFALVGAVRRPERVLCIGLALAALGWGLDTQTKVETDITKLVPQSLGSLQALGELERTTGVAGEIDLMVSGRNVATPATIEWMSSYQSTVLSRFGYSATRGCGRARLCPAFSLPDLFQGQATGRATRQRLSQGEVSALLGVIPPYFSQDVITPDRRAATLAFGIRVMSLQQQQSLIESMRSSLHPPAGITASLVGLPVLAAQSGSQVADPWRRLLTLLVGLAAVALVLLLAFRGDRRRALVPLVPIVLATGWSALILFAVRVPLNPMSVTLGALVIAISTEFSVLLAERHRQERLAGHDTIEALRRSYRRTGAAVVASGVTATAGFGVLAFSDIRMLRDFGLVTLIDLSVSLVGVLVALPAVLVIADRGAEDGSGQELTGVRRGPRATAGRVLVALRSASVRGGAPGRRARGTLRRDAGSGHGRA